MLMHTFEIATLMLFHAHAAVALAAVGYWTWLTWADEARAGAPQAQLCPAEIPRHRLPPAPRPRGL